jgi:hypothetical protein
MQVFTGEKWGAVVSSGVVKIHLAKLEVAGLNPVSRYRT